MLAFLPELLHVLAVVHVHAHDPFPQTAESENVSENVSVTDWRGSADGSADVQRARWYSYIDSARSGPSGIRYFAMSIQPLITVRSNFAFFHLM